MKLNHSTHQYKIDGVLVMNLIILPQQRDLIFSMLKQSIVTCILFVLFTGSLIIKFDAPAWGHSINGVWGAFSATQILSANSDEHCGEKVRPAKYYSDASLYSLIAGFILVFAGIFTDKKALKLGVWILAAFPFAFWIYVNYFVDFERTQKLSFTYDTIAENTLANIAEAQDRYKSEQDTFIKDLDQLYSHMAGSHGIDECVKILKIEAKWDHWAAQAKHVSSPDKVFWDSRTGSSLKKG